VKSAKAASTKTEASVNRSKSAGRRNLRQEMSTLGQNAVGAAAVVAAASVGVAQDAQLLEAAVEVLLSECACW
jgi:hypothetical protein